MAGRLCGYCRQEGHRADSCAEKAGIRNQILAHTPRERKFILDLMVKNGWGEGATFILKDWYNNNTHTYVLIDADFIRRWQFGAQKRIKYSKQLRFTPISPVEKTPDGKVADIRWQYESVIVQALSFGAGGSEIREVRIPVRCILAPTMFDGNNITDREPRLIEASHKPYDVEPSLYTENVIIHRRVAQDQSRRTSQWDETFYETGILPV